MILPKAPSRELLSAIVDRRPAALLINSATTIARDSDAQARDRRIAEVLRARLSTEENRVDYIDRLSLPPLRPILRRKEGS